MYVNDFLLALNKIGTLNKLKQSLAKKYDIKNLGEVKTIIGWQINQDTAVGTIKIHQSAFVQDLVIKEGLTDYNSNIIPMKAGLSIEMSEPENYGEADLRSYQRLVGKLM